MGYSASLPSLESLGRPFGTERPPNSSLERHIKRQTETSVPVERLNREVEAGGRHRSRRARDSDGRRGQRGTRPEEVRAERKADESTSRRSQEAQSRTRAEKRQGAQGGGRFTQASPRDGGLSEPSGDFPTELRAQGTKAPVEEGAPKATPNTDSESNLPLSNGVLPLAPQAVRVGGLATSGTPTGSAGAITASAAPKASTLPAALMAPGAVDGKNANGAEPGTKASERNGAHELSTTRWSETEEAQRASGVLRQFRMHLNPALRSAVIQLAPAELGRLSVRVRVEDGRVHAAVRAEKEGTLEILERHLPELEEAFAQQGLETAEFSLELGFGDSGDRAAPFEPPAGSVAVNIGSETETNINSSLLARAAADQAGVDTYA